MDEMTDEVVGGTVVREPAIIAGRDETHATQRRQLVTRRRERQPERVGDVANCHLGVGQGMQE